MAIVGSAEIIVRAITTQVRDDIRKALQSARSDIAKEGEAAGQAYSDGFGKGSSSNLGKAFEDSLKRANLGSVADTEGRNAGEALMQGVGDEIDKSSTDIEQRATNAFSRAGKGGGDGFLRGFLASGFSSAAREASTEFTAMEGVFNTLGPAIAGLVNLLGSGAAALFAMGAAASQAAGALAVIPGVISVAAQSIGVLKLAFTGVTKAISAGFKDATNTIGTTAQTAISNARAISDARTALSRAQADAKTAEADATNRVAQAEAGVAAAQRNTLAAQNALNAAREAGVKELRDLAFQAEDAGLAEKQAGLDLETARQKLVEAQALPPDDQARQQAELSFQQADLAYREAKARNQDLQQEQKKAAKTGVDGTQAVTSAQQKLNSAKQAQSQAEKTLADAREARQKTELQNTRSIQDAQLRLTRAIQDQATAQSKATATANAYQQALAKLSPPAQEFVKHLVAMKPAFDALKTAAGEELFPKLTAGLDQIAKTLLPVLEDQFRVTGGLLGSLGQQFANTISTGEGLKTLQDILKGNNDILKIFTQQTSTGRTGVGNFVIVIERLLKVIQPITDRFATWINQLGVTAEKATDSGKEINKLAGFLQHAGDVAAQLGRIFGNLVQAVVILAGGSNKAGQGLLDSFEKSTKELDKFLQKLRDDGSLQKFFGTAATNLKAVGKLFDSLFVQLVRISNSDATAKFAGGIAPAVKALGDIGVKLRDASTGLAPFIRNMADFFNNVISTEHTGAFIKTLTVISGILNDIVQNKFAQQLIVWGAGIFGVTRAISFALTPIKFFFLAFAGGPQNALKSFTKLQDGIGKIGKAFGALRTGGPIAAFKALGDSSEKERKLIEKQIETDQLKKKVLKEMGLQADITAGQMDAVGAAAAPSPASKSALEKDLQSSGGTGTSGLLAAGGGTGKLAADAEKDAGKLEKTGGKFSKIFGSIGKAVGGAASLFLPFEVSLEGVGAAIGAAIAPILLIVAAIAAFIGMFVLLYKQSPQFKKFIDGIVGKIKELVHWFSDVALPKIEEFGKWIGEKFVNLVVPPLNSFFGVVNETLPKIGATFSVVFQAIGDAYTKFLAPVFSVIGTIIVFLWDHVIKPYLKLIVLFFEAEFKIIKAVWEDVLKPVFNAIIDIIKFLWKTIVKPYFTLIGDFIALEFRGIKVIWNNVLHPVFTAIGTVVSGLADIFKSVFNTISNIWSNFVSTLRDTKNTIGDIIGNIVDAFTSIGDAIAGAFKGLGKFAASGLNSFIGFLNNNLIDKVNSVTSHFGFKIDTIKTIALAEGGRVKGPGGDKDDQIPAWLSNNEFVINARAAKKIGYGPLEELNRGGGLGWPHPHLPSFSDIKHLGGETINGVKNVGETITKDGVGKVLSAIVKGAEKLMSGPFPRGKGLDDLFYGILDKLADHVQTWGGGAGKGVADPAKSYPTGKFPSWVKKSGKWAFPVAGPYTYNAQYPYGAHPSANYWHTGSDFDARVGTPVIAMGQGRVTGVTDLGDRSYGRYVTINYGAFQTLYAHMNAFAAGLRVGMGTKAGTPIGQVGFLGNVIPHSPAGAHLHLEASRIGKFGSMSNTFDPLELLRRLGFKFAQGGIVSPTDGGILGVIGEAGHHERIEPLDNEGFSKRDRAILDMIQQAISQSKGDTLIVNPSKGMDEMELAAVVARRMQFRRRTGT